MKSKQEIEIDAYSYAGNEAHKYAQSIGKHDLATFTADEWVLFCKIMCEKYQEKIIELLPF